MESTLPLVDFLTEAKRILPAHGERLSTNLLDLILAHTANGWLMREGVTRNAEVKAAVETARQVIQTAAILQSGFAVYDITQWLPEHTAEDLRELWELGLELCRAYPVKAKEPVVHEFDATREMVIPQVVPGRQAIEELPALPEPA